MGFPFLEKEVFEVKQNKMPLYKLMFLPDLAAKHPTLVFIGFIQPFGAIPPISELQSRWAVQVLKVNST